MMIVVIGSLVIFSVTILLYGHAYYTTPVTERYHSPLHSFLKPGGEGGRLMGLAGSSMMITLLAYSLRKRVGFMRNWGKLGHWLQVHICLGIAGPVIITFHTAFKLRGIVAVSYWSMVIVAVSGLVGRYLYAQIPKAISGKEHALEEIQQQIQSINVRLSQLLDPARLRQVEAIADFHAPASPSAARALLTMISDDIRWIFRKQRLHSILATTSLHPKERSEVYLLSKQREQQIRQTAFLRTSQNLFRYWHIFHIPLAQTMYLTMAIHIGVAVMTGYL